MADLVYLAGGQLPPDGAAVIVTEGEPAADAAAETGAYAVATVCGASSTPGPAVISMMLKWKPTLSPDNDPGGAGHMSRLAAALERAGLPALRWIDPPAEAPKGWDLADVELDERRALIAGTRELVGFGLGDPRPAGDDVLALWHRHPPVAAMNARDQSSGADGRRPDGWETPTPLDAVDVRPAFPTWALPDAIRGFVEAEAEAVQVPPDLPALVCLAVLATVAGGRALVEGGPGWVEGLNLFTLVAMDPGERKSAVFLDATAPILLFEEELIEAATPAIRRRRVEHEIAEKRLSRLQEAAAKETVPDQRMAAAADAQAAADELAALPLLAEPQRFTTDVTSEKLASLLSEHDGQFALLSAEGGAFDRIAGLYSGGLVNLDVFLKGHAGDAIKIDRLGRPSERINHPALTLGLTVTPSSLVTIRSNRAIRGRRLLERFLYAMPNGRMGSRAVDPAPMPPEIARRYGAMVLGLARSLAALDEPIRIGLDPKATARFQAFRAALEPRRGPTGDLASISGWASKLDGAVARIAGLLHLARHLEDGFGRPIDADTMDAATVIGDYLVIHALVAFDEMGADEHRTGARAILAWITEGRREKFRRREVQRALHRQFPRIADLEPALGLLEEHGYIRPDGARRGVGRPPGGYAVCPYPLVTR
jgi:hypothetical protein